MALSPSLAPADVRISNMHNLNLGTYTGNGDLTAQDDICVYNSAGPNYDITVTSINGTFEMSSGGSNLSYTVSFKENSGSFQSLSYNNPTQFSGADTSSNSCSGLTNATVQIKIVQSDLLSVRPGSYSGTIVLLVSPA